MNVPAILFAGFAAIAQVVAVWFTVEAILLASHQPPITWYIRNNVSWHGTVWVITGILLVSGLVMGVTHFIIDVKS